ncbi:MAG: hypothetical protein ACT6FG_08460 [Methanosarcinaceae archaeon]
MTVDEIEQARIDMIVDDLHSNIVQIKRDMKVTRVNPGTVYLSAASEICNIGASNVQVHQILTRQKNLDAMNKTDDLLAKYMPYLLIMAACAAIVLVTILVLDYAK